VESHDVVEEAAGYCCCSVGMTEGKKMNVHGKSVHHRENHRLAIHPWQSLDEIHCRIFPNDRRHLQRLQQPHRVKVLGLVSLIDSACSHELLHCRLSTRDVEICSEMVQGLLNPLMSDVVCRF
jgi:hypothetical protein